MSSIKNGRPTIFTHELAEEICQKISSHATGIGKLCSENSHWPNKGVTDPNEASRIYQQIMRRGP